MLNELYQASHALEARNQAERALGNPGVPLIELHSALEPLGKSTLLLVKLDDAARPASIEMWASEEAGKLLRVKHGSQGSYFPGLNLPLPLRTLAPIADNAKLTRLVEALKSRNSLAPEIAAAVADLFPESAPSRFETREIAAFRRSTHDLVAWVSSDLASAPEPFAGRLGNFKRLLDVVAAGKVELPAFAEHLACCIRDAHSDLSRDNWKTLAKALFGEIYLSRVKEPIGSGAYWRAKQQADGKLDKQAIYLELAKDSTDVNRVADPRTGRLLNECLLKLDPSPYDSASRTAAKPTKRKPKTPAPPPPPARDAYTGEDCKLLQRFPEPKLAVLGNTKLFANNASDAECFLRYGLGDSRTFGVSPETVHKMSAAVFTLAGDDLALPVMGGQVASGRTCRAIPPQRKDKGHLLIAYLEHKPDAPDPWVDLFGAQASDVASPDYGEATKPVMAALDAEALVRPNEMVRLMAIAEIDNANKQVSLNRSFTVMEVKRAVDFWRSAAANCPLVPLTFWSEKENRTVPHNRTIPGPLDVASVLNSVWATHATLGYKDSFQRAFSATDAFELFIGSDASRQHKARSMLAVLLARMRPVFARAAISKVASDWQERESLYKRLPLNERARWQVLKAVSLIGMFLRQLNQEHKIFMNDTVYQVGRLLALADGLHFQYCKWVRTSDKKREEGKVDAPTELLGNSLFNFSLDDPAMALARLAERIRPYKGWADSYTGSNAERIQELVHKMGECAAQIDLVAAKLPPRMEDIHKAQLLLGYLADYN